MLHTEYIFQLTDMAGFLGMKQKIEDANHALRNALLMPRKVDEEIDVSEFQKKLTALEKVRHRKEI